MVLSREAAHLVAVVLFQMAVFIPKTHTLDAKFGVLFEWNLAISQYRLMRSIICCGNTQAVKPASVKSSFRKQTPNIHYEIFNFCIYLPFPGVSLCCLDPPLLSCRIRLCISVCCSVSSLPHEYSWECLSMCLSRCTCRSIHSNLILL